MDPASLAIGIVGLAENVSQVVEYLHDVREGGKQRLRLSAETSALWVVLKNIQSQLKSTGKTNQAALKHLLPLGKPNGILKQCSDVIAILENKLRPKSGAKGVIQTLRWPFDKDDVDRYLETIHRLQNTITLAYAQASLSLIEVIAEDSQRTRTYVEEQEFRSMLNWLSPIDFEPQQRQIFESACPGTGQSILSTNKLDVWINGECRYFHSSGPPGCGKTTMAALIINHLRQNLDIAQTPVLGVYCQNPPADPELLTTANVVGSFLKQLVSINPPAGDALIKHYRDNIRPSTLPNVNELAEQFSGLTSHFKKLYLILDGIDTFPSGPERSALIKFFSNLTDNVFVYIISRASPLTTRLLPPLHNLCDVCENSFSPYLYHCEDHPTGGYDICVRCFEDGNRRCPDPRHGNLEKLQNCINLHIKTSRSDLELYVERRLAEDEGPLSASATGRELHPYIIKAVVDKASDTFLYAKTYMDHLATLSSLREVKEALSHLPQDIYETYQQALESIDKLKPAMAAKAREAIKWVMCADIQLRGTALEHAMALTPRAKFLDLNDVISAHKLVTMCGGLVVFGYNNRLSIVHPTARDYLEPWILQHFPHADEEIAVKCITYLMLGPDLETTLRDNSGFPSLFNYAVLFWARHLGKTPTGELFDLTLDFLMSPHSLKPVTELHGLQAEDDNEDIPYATGLRVASYFGLTTLVEAILARTQDHRIIEISDKFDRTALLLAVVRGYPDTTKALLRAGASTTCKDKHGLHPLHVAIAGFKPDTAMALLESKSCDVNLKCRSMGHLVTPLILAARRCNHFMITKLLEHPKIDINDTTTGTTALIAALEAGQTQSAKLLMQDPRCVLELVDSRGFMALQWAVTYNNMEALIALLENGANVNHIDSRGTGALLAAVLNERFDMIDILVKHNANIYAINDAGQSCFHIAAQLSNIRALAMLIDAASKTNPVANDISPTSLEEVINSQDRKGDTPLHVAVLFGHIETVDMLLRHDADPDIANKAGQTPPQAAAEYGREAITNVFTVWVRGNTGALVLPGEDTEAHSGNIPKDEQPMPSVVVSHH